MIISVFFWLSHGYLRDWFDQTLALSYWPKKEAASLPVILPALYLSTASAHALAASAASRASSAVWNSSQNSGSSSSPPLAAFFASSSRPDSSATFLAQLSAA